MTILGAALAGATLGSFLNVIATRLPAGESVARPRSHCRDCGRPLRLADLMPVLSFALLRGACRDCGARIPLRYPLVEAFGAALVVWAAAGGWSDPLHVLLRIAFLSLLLTLLVTDLERMILPDRLTLGGLAAGLAFAALGLPPGPLEAALGAVVGVGLPCALRFLYLRWRGVEALGLGDVKMLGMVGAFLGPAGVFQTLGLGSALALLATLPLLLLGRISRTTRIPFGAFLALAAAAAFVLRERA